MWRLRVAAFQPLRCLAEPRAQEKPQLGIVYSNAVLALMTLSGLSTGDDCVCSFRDSHGSHDKDRANRRASAFPASLRLPPVLAVLPVLYFFPFTFFSFNLIPSPSFFSLWALTSLSPGWQTQLFGLPCWCFGGDCSKDAPPGGTETGQISQLPFPVQEITAACARRASACAQPAWPRGTTVPPQWGVAWTSLLPQAQKLSKGLNINHLNRVFDISYFSFPFSDLHYRSTIDYPLISTWV